MTNATHCLPSHRQELADAAREAPLRAWPAVLDAAQAVVVVLVPLNPRGIWEAEAIRIGSQLWVVTQWHGAASSPQIWRPARMICTEGIKYSPMGSRLVLDEPMPARVFKGKRTSASYEVWLHPEIFVHFGASLPLAEVAGRSRRQLVEASCRELRRQSGRRV